MVSLWSLYACFFASDAAFESFPARGRAGCLDGFVFKRKRSVVVIAISTWTGEKASDAMVILPLMAGNDGHALTLSHFSRLGAAQPPTRQGGSQIGQIAG
ncbi:MAG: hypothetical protein AAGH42_08555 [Pseudomonadota bacterium]